MSEARRTIYRAGSVLGDIEAVSSLDPQRIARRFLRKRFWRVVGRLLRGI